MFGLGLLVHDRGPGGQTLGPEPELPSQVVGHDVVWKKERDLGQQGALLEIHAAWMKSSNGNGHGETATSFQQN